MEVTYSQTPRTVYFLKDHLGSIRATVQDTSTAPVCGYDDYDPWGYILADRSVNSVCGPTPLVTRNKFTGKEWDDEFGLNWYDFPPREYDPQIGRFLSLDPHADKYPHITPYNYAFNNPLRYIDPTGADGEESNQEEQKKKELTKDDLLRFVKQAQQGGQDVLSTVITQIGNL